MKKLDTRDAQFGKEFSQLLKQRAEFKTGLMAQVQKIFSAIEKSGEKALLEFARKFDGFSGSEKDLKVSASEINSAEKELSRSQIRALRVSANRIEKFHSRQIPTGYLIRERGGYLEERWLALRCVGIYVPGGTAPLASTVLMTAIPARLAGAKRVVLCTPAGKDGVIHPAILFSAKLAGVSEIYKVGGAHAIAAMALGAGLIPKVDKIVGPGGVWVSVAKVYAQSRGLCGIDTLAGPSEIVILADGSVQAEFAIADLKAQLEHGEAGWAFLISTDSHYLAKVWSGIKLSGKNLFFIKAQSTKEMIDLANQIAPEHLEIHTQNPERLVSKLFGPAAIYLGPDSPVAVGDYLAGPNHCLPTGERARFDSPLGVWDFMKRQSVVKLSKKLMKKLSKLGAEFAEMEGLKEHSNSLRIRMKK